MGKRFIENFGGRWKLWHARAEGGCYEGGDVLDFCGAAVKVKEGDQCVVDTVVWLDRDGVEPDNAMGGGRLAMWMAAVEADGRKEWLEAIRRGCQLEVSGGFRVEVVVIEECFVETAG